MNNLHNQIQLISIFKAVLVNIFTQTMNQMAMSKMKEVACFVLVLSHHSHQPRLWLQQAAIFSRQTKLATSW